MPSEFTRYWSRIDNCPGSLERLSTKQAAEVKEMVKAAFHANTHHYHQRIAALEAKLDAVWDEVDNLDEAFNHPASNETYRNIRRIVDRIKELEKYVKTYQT